MIVRFSRPKGKPVLTCIRDDGSVVYTRPRQGEFFARHDLMHYAVESTLGLKQSFYGLIAAGWSIEALSETGVAARLPDEGKLTEFLVGPMAPGLAFGTPSTAEEFNATVSAAVTQASGGKLTPPRPVSDKTLDQIRSLFAQLI